MRKDHQSRPTVENLEHRLLMAVDANDQISEAVASTIGVAMRGKTLTSVSDVNMYKFFVNSGETVFFDMDRGSGNLDAVFRLFRSDGTQLAISDDQSAPGEGPTLDPYLEFTVSRAGTYFLGVSSVPNTGYNPLTGVDQADTRVTSGKFSIFSGMVGADPNDSASEASNYPLRGASGHRIETPNDVDLFSIDADAGEIIQVDLDSVVGSGLDSFMVLLNADGLVIASSDDTAAPGELFMLDSFVRALVPRGGLYYIAVSAYNNVNYNIFSGDGDLNGASTGGYTLTTRVIDGDDQISEAQTITLGTPAFGFISKGTDVDMYSFTVQAGQKVTFDIDRPSIGLSFDSFIRIFDTNGVELASNDDGPNLEELDSTESFFPLTFTTGGTYFVAVSGKGNSTYNPLTGSADLGGSRGDYILRVNLDTTFNIGFRFAAGFTDSQKAAFYFAADRWSQVIVGDLPDVGGIDDLLIDVSLISFDGRGNILADAAPVPASLRPGSRLPAQGFMRFDTSDIGPEEVNGSLRAVVLHEMGHVLGIGSLWSTLGLVAAGPGVNNPVFTGANAVREFRSVFGGTGQVPIENGGGVGTVGGHWRESVFDRELMTGFIDGNSDPLSRITIGSLQDLGYTVNYSAADAYSKPPAAFSARRIESLVDEGVAGTPLTVSSIPFLSAGGLQLRSGESPLIDVLTASTGRVGEDLTSTWIGGV